MLGYLRNTTKIWRIWDFKSGRTGRAVECSSVVFDEEESERTEEQTDAIEFPDTTDEAQTNEAQDAIHEMNDAHVLENTSKKQISYFFRHAVNSLDERLGDMCYTCRIQRMLSR